MGQRGPNPKPVELRLLEGRGHRPLDLTATFRPEVGAPTPPRWLSREAVKAWKRLTPELIRYNLLSTVDRDSLSMLCQTIGRLELVERAIAARQRLAEAETRQQIAAGAADKSALDAAGVRALLSTTPNGLEIQGALYQVLNREQDKLHRLLEAWGLRPDARAKVTAGIRAQLQLFPGGAGPDAGGAPGSNGGTGAAPSAGPGGSSDDADNASPNAGTGAPPNSFADFT